MPVPHASAPILTASAPLAEAAGAVVLLHGRGASAESILGLAAEFGRDDLAVLAPQADGGAWYPTSFLAPLDANEPWLSGALAAVMRAVEAAREAGLRDHQIAIGGFSQGACLAVEAVARNARRWGGAFALSGGLLGTGPGPADAPPLRGMGGLYPAKGFDYAGSLGGTPVFLGCSDADPHIPAERVRQSAAALAALGGEVDARIYPGLGHTVNADELAAVRALLARL